MARQDKKMIVQKDHRHWKIRLLIAISMLTLSFIGLVVSDFRKNGAWDYWRVMVPVFAPLCLFLSWYLRHKEKVITQGTIWHELVQWLGLALAVYLVSVFVNIRLMRPFEGGLVVLILLALNIFITGIYVETTFFVIGILLGFFALATALLTKYIYTMILPITIGVIVLVTWLARRRF